MKLLCSILCVCFAFALKAGDPLPSFNSTSSWSFNYGFCADKCTPDHQHYLYLDGDTVYRGISYKIVRKYSVEKSVMIIGDRAEYEACVAAGACDPIDDEIIYHPPSLAMLLRESNDSIYKVLDFTKEDDMEVEELFYVNNLKKGDYLITVNHPSPGVLVDSTADVNIGGELRRVSFLNEGFQIIEGIGLVSEESLFTYAGLVYQQINVSGMFLGSLTCFGEEGIENYSKEENSNLISTSDLCVQPFADILSSGGALTKLPFYAYATGDGGLYVSSDYQRLMVWDVNGRKVFQSDKPDNQNLSGVFSLPGIYIIQLEREDQLYQTKVLFK